MKNLILSNYRYLTVNYLSSNSISLESCVIVSDLTKSLHVFQCFSFVHASKINVLWNLFSNQDIVGTD